MGSKVMAVRVAAVGVLALQAAAENQHIEMMGMLTSAEWSILVQAYCDGGRAVVNVTPLALVHKFLGVKIVGGKDPTESQLHGLEAIRRLLMRVEAVHAIAWLSGVSDVASITLATTGYA
eukprot:g17813.t1